MKRQNLRTVSLIVVTFTYLLIGAAIFGYLESEHEVRQREYLDLIELIVKRKYNITDDDFTVLTTTVIKSVPHRAGIQWKFPGAFYFATTVVTTIGYGHSTPATMAGRSFCMIYALIGIPLGLVMFQSIGERLNTFVGCALKYAKRCVKARNPEVTQTNLVMVVSVLSTILMTSMAAVFAKYERWDYFDALYYCFITLTTIGFGDYVALQKESALQSKPEYVALSLIFILFGLSVVSSAVNLLVLKFLTLNTEDERRDEQLRYTANLNPILLKGDVITSSASEQQQQHSKKQLPDCRDYNRPRLCLQRPPHGSDIGWAGARDNEEGDTNETTEFDDDFTDQNDFHNEHKLHGNESCNCVPIDPPYQRHLVASQQSHHHHHHHHRQQLSPNSRFQRQQQVLKLVDQTSTQTSKLHPNLHSHRHHRHYQKYYNSDYDLQSSCSCSWLSLASATANQPPETSSNTPASCSQCLELGAGNLLQQQWSIANYAPQTPQQRTRRPDKLDREVLLLGKQKTNKSEPKQEIIALISSNSNGLDAIRHRTNKPADEGAIGAISTPSLHTTNKGQQICSKSSSSLADPQTSPPFADRQSPLDPTSQEEMHHPTTKTSEAIRLSNKRPLPKLVCKCCCQHLECIEHALQSRISREPTSKQSTIKTTSDHKTKTINKQTKTTPIASTSRDLQNEAQLHKAVKKNQEEANQSDANNSTASV